MSAAAQYLPPAQFAGRGTATDPATALVRAIHRNWSIEAIALLLYLGRDAYAGAFRYYLSLVHLDIVWFIPDLAAMVCTATFIHRYVYRQRNLAATLVVLAVCFALVLCYVTLGNGAAVASSYKMFAPAFVGFCFADRKLSDYPFVLAAMPFLFYTSIVGVFVSANITVPWVGFEFESFGSTRTAATLWWAGKEVRLAGFAADSTMAGFFILMTFVLTSLRRNLLWVAIWGGVAMYTTNLTTSKTSLAVLILYVCALLLIRSVDERLRFRLLRFMALGSFVAVLIPPVLIVAFAGIDITQLSDALFSMQDRIDNSWQKPFVYMIDMLPIGYVTGCGLGCFNYPQALFPAPEIKALYVPVDNFYLGTYLMFGVPFVVFLFFVVQALRKSDDYYRLTLTFVINLYTITILSYGPASGLLLIALTFGAVFGGPPPGLREGRLARLRQFSFSAR